MGCLCAFSLHPGTDFSGPSAAIKGLYEGKTNIICEVERTAFKLQEKALELLKLWECVFDTWIQKRMTNILHMSHLSHISAFMLGKTVINKEKHEQDIFDMAGSLKVPFVLPKVHQPCGRPF
jgi:prephenate dehydrogenase